MSTINGLTGPRLPTATPSTTREAPSTSFLSRVQASASGVSTLSRSANAPVVSGRDVVSQALAAAKKDAKTGAATQGTGETEEMLKQKEALLEMSRAFVMGTVQSIFAGVGQASSSLPKEEWG
ncbi:hypothetical protein F0U60_35365 [Archangium minus]|uniref:Uncharacterized protein n=1 Tax=Archangium minus TaxID=83450 RepID=A0ABY9X0A0_9BACT|nr:hypothetical protein F0U61_35260 [Archangium violaceum]WNG48811.1 hypothetical protein F0U60_35365 [Archangium minus]